MCPLFIRNSVCTFASVHYSPLCAALRPSLVSAHRTLAALSRRWGQSYSLICAQYTLEVNCEPCSALVCAPFSDMFTVQCCCSHHAKSQLAAVQCSAQRGALKASHLEWVLLIQRFNCAPCYTMHLHFCPHPNLPITLQPSPGATFQTQAALLCAALSCFVVFLGG